jgi:hypothetical protein
MFRDILATIGAVTVLVSIGVVLLATYLYFKKEEE